MVKTPDEIKKALECCFQNSEQCVDCPYYPVTCDRELVRDAREYIRQLEAERDAMKEALGLMVYQYCVSGTELDHRYMCAGETAFRVLGLEQYGDTSSLESWLFPEPSKEE